MFFAPAKPLALRMAILGAVLAAISLLSTAAVAQASTSAQVRSAVSKVGGRASVYVYDITANQAIASKNAGAKRIVASNAKLYTGAAVLERYGTGGRFTTGIWTNGTQAGSILTGDVYLRGGGDPLFGSADYVGKNFGSQATVQRLALNLRTAGIDEISGRIFGDETAFDSRRGTAKYGYRASWEIGGSLSGLVYNKGTSGGKFQSDPPRFAAQKLRLALKAAGIKVSNKIGVGATPKDARRIAFVQSLPMASIVRQMNKPSNNYLAEMLVKSLALPEGAADDDGGIVEPGTRPATTRAGGSFARRHAASFGARVSLADGSGLSRNDKAAAREVVDLLRGVAKESESEDFAASLPIAGVDGTLNNRMKGTAAKRKCSAKTGTLSNVSALSGYCTTVSGHRVAFSILQNLVYPGTARSQQDRVAAMIAGLN